jgi:hypothetical protein
MSVVIEISQALKCPGRGLTHLHRLRRSGSDLHGVITALREHAVGVAYLSRVYYYHSSDFSGTRVFNAAAYRLYELPNHSIF